MTEQALGMIGRPQTNEEKKDFIDISTNIKRSFERVMREKLKPYEYKYAKLHKPFCARCLKLDIQDQKEKLEKEYMRKLEANTNPDWNKIVQENIDLSNADDYADQKRFNKVKESETREKTIIGNTSVMRHSGYQIDYECKFRGCGNSVFIPIEEWEEWNKKEKK